MSKKELDSEKQLPVIEDYRSYRDNIVTGVTDDNVRALVAAILTLAQATKESKP